MTIIVVRVKVKFVQNFNVLQFLSPLWDGFSSSLLTESSMVQIQDNLPSTKQRFEKLDKNNTLPVTVPRPVIKLTYRRHACCAVKSHLLIYFRIFDEYDSRRSTRMTCGIISHMRSNKELRKSPFIQTYHFPSASSFVYLYILPFSKSYYSDLETNTLHVGILYL